METNRLGKNTNTLFKVIDIQLLIFILPDFLCFYNESLKILGEIGKVVVCGGTKERRNVSKYENVYYSKVLDNLNFTT